MNSESRTRPLCVDLDGTLIHSDLLLETFLLLCKRNPLYLLLVPFWLLQGKAVLKAEIAKRIQLNPVALPYNLAFMSWLTEQKEGGRVLWLCTASNYRLADQVAEHLTMFEGVLASTDSVNMSGSTKARHLVEKFGERGFDYCGNHHVDLAIWTKSYQAIVVNGDAGLVQKATVLTENKDTLVFPKKPGFIKPVLKALRLHQWAKNMLIFVPLVAAHQMGNMTAMSQAVMAFFAFGLCASSVYLLNDMLDLESDRLHARKRKRPFASGDLSLVVGFALIPLLLIGVVLFAHALPVKFWIALGAYYSLTVAYSFGLKSVALIDTIALAGLYTVRIVAGAKAIDVALSFWLLLFSVFLFLSLALVKRYAELDALQRQGKLKAAGRGYHVEDLPILQSMGAASGFLCVLILALYINSPEVLKLYRLPQVIWFLCVLLLFWISRVWLITHRGDMHDDPVVFAIKDPVSIVVGVLVGLTVLIAT
ncbi:4-hydroxybenzoate polyprenyltransferase/phosphoserine phosphatase [Oxalobacteraceae bacterium GrIS 2.11]